MNKTIQNNIFFSKLLKDFFSYGAIGATSKFIGFFTIPIYARYFSPTEFGVIEILSLLVAILTIFSTLQLENSFLRLFFEKKEEYAQKELFSTGLYVIVFFSFIILIILLLVRLPLSKYLLGSDKFTSLLVISLLQLPFNNVFGYTSMIYRVEFKRKQYSILQLSFIFLNVFFGIFSVAVLNLGLIGLFASRTILVFIYSLIALFIVKRYILKSFSFSMLKEMFNFSLPLIPGSLSYWLQRQIARIYIFVSFDLYQLGIYAVASKLAIPIMLIISSLKMAWTPYSYENFEKNDSKNNFNRFLNLFSFLGFILVVSLTLFSKEILVIFATNKFLKGYLLVGWVVLANVFIGQTNLIGVLLGIKKKSKEWSITAIIGVITSIIAMYLFSKAFNLVGIVIGGLFGNIVQFFILTKIINNHAPGFFIYNKTFIFQFSSIVFVSCFYLLQMTLLNVYIKIIITIILVLISLVLFFYDSTSNNFKNNTTTLRISNIIKNFF